MALIAQPAAPLVTRSDRRQHVCRIDPARDVAALRFAAERHHTQRGPDSDAPYLVHVASSVEDF